MSPDLFEDWLELIGERKSDNFILLSFTSDDKWVIEKLDGSNWTSWKFQMKHLLLAKGFWGLAEGTKVLGEDANDQVQADFQQKLLKPFYTIVLAISSS